MTHVYTKKLEFLDIKRCMSPKQRGKVGKILGVKFF